MRCDTSRRSTMWLQFLLVPEVRVLRFKIAGQTIVLKQNAVLEGLVPAFDLALGLRMATRGANVRYAVANRREPNGIRGSDTEYSYRSCRGSLA